MGSGWEVALSYASFVTTGLNNKYVLINGAIFESKEAPKILRNQKEREIIPPRKKRYQTLVGSEILSRRNISLTIVCKATGTPAPTITWLRNGNRVSSKGNVKIKKGGRLRIKSLSENNVGQYQCRAGNSFGYDAAASNIIIRS
ncbi:contactin-5-like [Xenia sp. Carnegie-2017]|uniref:contactin-5-like n=1 Tax=Xenia sp. Carnegie-2017 TaxID=2897299 RepID=UPI001F04C887|nr:contactin-5-like [Xenia sp. Carnegie-2017]